MSRSRRRAVWALLTAAAAVTAFLIMRPPPRTVVQPIAFNHNRHVMGPPKLGCLACHAGAEREAHASLPSLDRCLLCHMKPQSASPAEAKVREVAARGEPMKWTQITRNPGHVNFSHRAHVSLARMDCATCHGDVASWTAPPTEPQAKLMSMDACLNCHRERGASTNCRVCHH